MFSVREYIRSITQNRSTVALTLEFNKRTRTAYWLFWTYYNLRICPNSFSRMFAADLRVYFRRELALAQKLSLIVPDGNGFVLTAKGAHYFHVIEQHFIHQYIDKTWRIMRGTPRPQ
ncbi:MAG: hypothetical protein P8107_11840 [Spirochaetia bacterium]